MLRRSTSLSALALPFLAPLLMHCGAESNTGQMNSGGTSTGGTIAEGTAAGGSSSGGAVHSGGSVSGSTGGNPYTFVDDGELGNEYCGGECGADQVCFEDNCYTRYGVPPGQDPELMRGLFTAPEGQAFTITADGALALLEVALWTDESDAEVSIYTYASASDSADGSADAGAGARTLLRNTVLSAEGLPAYDGIRSDLTPVRVVLDPPLPVHAGQKLDVLFSAPQGVQPQIGCVSGIRMSDVDPNSHFISTEYWGIDRTEIDWDYMVALYVR